jgi:prepilin-type N-terminal cleavage/methylation domain-containing protein
MFFNINKKEKGFTLIELLVVVAIIGILASVILVNLSRTRLKGKDASLQSSMSSARVAAELYFSDNSFSYLDMCDGSTDPDMTRLINAIIKVSNSPDDGVGDVCTEAAPNGFSIEANMNADTAQYYCVDATGYSGTSDGSAAGVCIPA